MTFLFVLQSAQAYECSPLSEAYNAQECTSNGFALTDCADAPSSQLTFRDQRNQSGFVNMGFWTRASTAAGLNALDAGPQKRIRRGDLNFSLGYSISAPFLPASNLDDTSVIALFRAATWSSWGLPPSLLAATTVVVDHDPATNSCYRVAPDILVNWESYWFNVFAVPSSAGPNQYAYRQVVTHEGGHALGLTHVESYHNAMATMQPGAGDYSGGDGVDEDTALGIQELYPASGNSSEINLRLARFHGAASQGLWRGYEVWTDTPSNVYPVPSGAYPPDAGFDQNWCPGDIIQSPHRIAPINLSITNLTPTQGVTVSVDYRAMLNGSTCANGVWIGGITGNAYQDKPGVLQHPALYLDPATIPFNTSFKICAIVEPVSSFYTETDLNDNIVVSESFININPAPACP